MKVTLIVPVDFTPVAHHALKYACEIAKIQDSEIVAVHLLDSNITAHIYEENLAMRKMAERMYNDIMQKTMDDLNNFISGLRGFYGDVIHPMIAHGTIYEAFNEVAAKYDFTMIVMGTHGITGMQHLLGSKAYKVVVHTPYPFLVVQEKLFRPVNDVYFAFKDMRQLQENAGRINTLAGCFPGKFIFNIISSGGNLTMADMPQPLQYMSDRIKLVNAQFHSNDNVADHARDAGAIGMCVDDLDSIDDEIYGLTQDKILVNKYGLPVLCLPDTASNVDHKTIVF